MTQNILREHSIINGDSYPKRPKFRPILHPLHPALLTNLTLPEHKRQKVIHPPTDQVSDPPYDIHGEENNDDGANET